MKTPIQELIEKYDNHLKNDNDLDTLSGSDVLKIVLVDLISYQVKEKECIVNTHIEGQKSMNYGMNSFKHLGIDYYKETFKQE